MEYYSITTQYSTYNIVVQPSKSGTGNDNIYLGGKEFYCVSVAADTLNVTKDAECHINEYFPKHIKQGVDMVNALIYFMKTKYGTCTLKLTDTSSNPECGSLSSYYLAFDSNNKTWYEKYFNARLNDSRVHQEYILQKQIFDSVQEKEKNTKFDILLKKSLNENDTILIMDIYRKSKTYRDFFQNLKKQYADFCPIIKPWLEKFVRITMNFDFIYNEEWLIKCDDNLVPDCTITEKFTDPFPKLYGNYIKIEQKNHYRNIQNGGSALRTLNKAERECFKSPRWIGWKKYTPDDFVESERNYLIDLLESFERGEYPE